METIWKAFSCFVALLFLELCNGLPLDLDHSYSDGHTQFLTGLIAVLLTICGVICLAGCLCCQRRNGFKEFRDSPVVISVASNLDHGHVNPIANGEFTIFTPLSPPHHNNNVFLANQQAITRAEEDYRNGNIDVSPWFGPSEQDFPRSKLKYIKEFGKGWFGRVVEGTAQGVEHDESAWTPVIVRILETTASSRQRVLFLHDASIYRCRPHPNLLKLLGRSLESIPLLLLQEHCTKGDLKLYLRQQKPSKEKFLNSELPLRWCYQLASAVKHLHSFNITHPDLASRNCQLSEELNLKLGDYGCSMSDYPEDYYHGTENIPVRWCAPESVSYTATTLQTKDVTMASNIWSLGVCLWEIYECGAQPYTDLSEDEVVSQVLGSSSVRLLKPSFNVLYTDYIYKLMQMCWLTYESRPQISQIEPMLADLVQVHENTKDAETPGLPIVVQDFDRRWETLKPNVIVKTDNHSSEMVENDLTNITVLNLNMGSHQDSKKLSASLHNLAGSFDNLLEPSRDPMDSWLDNVGNDDMSFVKGLSAAIHDLDTALASENISSSDSSPRPPQGSKLQFKLGPGSGDPLMRTSSESETEDETWKKKIECGAYTEKVRQKSRSVADLMVLTHIDCSESDSETPLPSLDFRLNYRNMRYGPTTKQNLENVSLKFGSEGNLLSVQDTFQDELKKLQEERRDSLLFVPDSFNEPNATAAAGLRHDSPAKKLMEDLNSSAGLEPQNQIFNVYNVVAISPKYSPIHAADLGHIINYKDTDKEERAQVLPDLVLNTIEGKRDVPRLSEIIENNIELMDYIITKYDSNPENLHHLNGDCQTCGYSAIEDKNEINRTRNVNGYITEMCDTNVISYNSKESLDSDDKSDEFLNISPSEDVTLLPKVDDIIYVSSRIKHAENISSEISDETNRKAAEENVNRIIETSSKGDISTTQKHNANDVRNMELRTINQTIQYADVVIENMNDKSVECNGVRLFPVGKMIECGTALENLKENPTKCYSSEREPTDLSNSTSKRIVAVDEIFDDRSAESKDGKVNCNGLNGHQNIANLQVNPIPDCIPKIEEHLNIAAEELSVPIDIIDEDEKITLKYSGSNLSRLHCATANDKVLLSYTDTVEEDIQSDNGEIDKNEIPKLSEVAQEELNEQLLFSKINLLCDNIKEGIKQPCLTEGHKMSIEEHEEGKQGEMKILPNNTNEQMKLSSNEDVKEPKVHQIFEVEDNGEGIMKDVVCDSEGERLVQSNGMLISCVDDEQRSSSSHKKSNIKKVAIHSSEEVELKHALIADKENEQTNSQFSSIKEHDDKSDAEAIKFEEKAILSLEKLPIETIEATSLGNVRFDKIDGAILMQNKVQSENEDNETALIAKNEQTISEDLSNHKTNEIANITTSTDNSLSNKMPVCGSDEANVAQHFADNEDTDNTKKNSKNLEGLINGEATKPEIDDLHINLSPEIVSLKQTKQTQVTEWINEKQLIVKTQDFINNEIVSYEDSNTPCVQFDISDRQEEIAPSSLTHSSLTSVPYKRQENSVILGASDDYSIDYYAGLKTTTDEERSFTSTPAKTSDLRYSLETWDNFLGRSFDEQHEFDSFSSEPKSMLFLDNRQESMTCIEDRPLALDATFVVNKVDEQNSVDLADITVEVDDDDDMKEGFDNPGYWESENSGGWFLHPQTNSEELSGQMDLSEDDSYVGFSMDDEVMAAIRNELLTKLPQAQRASSEYVEEGDEYETTDRNEVFIRYNCYNTPLSPIPEESYTELLYSGQSTPHCTINTDLGEADSDWSEPAIDPNLTMDEDTHSPRMTESPHRGPLNRHTPSQDSCCSNDTLFNLEELQCVEKVQEQPEETCGSEKLDSEVELIAQVQDQVPLELLKENLCKYNMVNEAEVVDSSLPSSTDNTTIKLIVDDKVSSDCITSFDSTERQLVEYSGVGEFYTMIEEKSAEVDKDEEVNKESTRMKFNEPVITITQADSGAFLEQEVTFITNEIKSSLVKKETEESSSSSETYLTVSDGYVVPNVAPLNSPEDRPWRHIEASLSQCPPEILENENGVQIGYFVKPDVCNTEDKTLSSGSDEEYPNNYENIEEMNLKNVLVSEDIYDYVESGEMARTIATEIKKPSVTINPEYVEQIPTYANEVPVCPTDVPIYADEVSACATDAPVYINELPSYANRDLNSASTEPDYANQHVYDDVNYEVYIDLMNEEPEVEYDNLDSQGSVEDVYGHLTDIRFTGPSDSQMMTTSFSDSNDLGEEQDWDSGSDTRSSSSGEFIWKEGEHEASVKALHAAPQDTETQQTGCLRDDEETSGSSEEEGDGPEFVPSAWDKYAMPMKSALRSPEKTADRPEKKPRGVSFKKQKYHCVYEYPREPESPIVQAYDIWQDPVAIDRDVDRNSDRFLPATSSDTEVVGDSASIVPLNHCNRQHQNLYQISNAPDFLGSSILDDDFYISSSAKPFDMFNGPSSQFFPGRHCDWSDLIKNNENVTPDSGVEDVTPGSLSDSSEYVRPSRQILPLKTLVQLAINKGSQLGNNEIGGLRHTRNRLKLDLPPSPSAFTKTFSTEPLNDPVSRQVPTFTTFGKSRFVVQHVDTPPGNLDMKNVSFEALPYKPMTTHIYRDDPTVEKHRVESVRGEASLLDSADEDSGIESCTLERKRVSSSDVAE